MVPSYHSRAQANIKLPPHQPCRVSDSLPSAETHALGVVVLHREADSAELTDLGRYAIRRVRGMAQPLPGSLSRHVPIRVRAASMSPRRRAARARRKSASGPQTPDGSPAAQRVPHRCDRTAARSTVRGSASARSASSLDLGSSWPCPPGGPSAAAIRSGRARYSSANPVHMSGVVSSARARQPARSPMRGLFRRPCRNSSRTLTPTGSAAVRRARRSGEAVLREYRLPQRRDRVGKRELRRLQRILGPELSWASRARSIISSKACLPGAVSSACSAR